MIKVLIVSLIVQVHDWYPMQCCGGHDCHPVPCESIIETHKGFEWNGYLFPQGSENISQDNTCHVCLHQSYDKVLPQCIFLLPVT